MGGNYKLIEARLESAVHVRFSLPASISVSLKKLIKRADQVAAFFEATRLAGFSETEATKYFGRPRSFDPSGLDLTPRPTQSVQNDFLARFATLEQARKK
jgi:5'-deoxynucleotidase YfbR-like HD superfamily hydrolase